MSNDLTFEREIRYCIFKISDVKKFLTPEERSTLVRIGDRIEAGRAADGRSPLSAVVVEHDWPEYETVWKMLKARMQGVTSDVPPIIPTEPLDNFMAMAQGRTDYSVDVINIHSPKFGDMMTICASEEAVYVTREQAKAFFGLAEPQQETATQTSEAEWEWEPLAYALCAEAQGEEHCHDLLWTSGTTPEPWGERWYTYEEEAKRMIALVREHAPHTTPPTDMGWRSLAVKMYEAMRHAPVGTGICCCGDNMDNHQDPFSCGHTPVDMWDYLVSSFHDDYQSLIKKDPSK